MPNSAPAKASEEPHWPAPVSVREPLDAGLLVVPGLRHRGVGLVRAGRRDALILVVDFGRRPELLLEPARADQRRRPPHAVDVAHRFGNLDVALGRDLLEDQRHRKQRLEIGRPDRLLGARMQHGRQRLRQVGRQVVPGLRNLGFVQHELDLIAHATLPRGRRLGLARTIHEGFRGVNSTGSAVPCASRKGGRGIGSC